MTAVAGAFFGLIVGWIIGSQQAVGRSARRRRRARPRQRRRRGPAQPAPTLDESRAAQLKSDGAAVARRTCRTRVQLGNLYFDAERFQDAAEWYEAALKIEPKDVNVSTDLGIAYYYMNQPDKALAQFDRSLAIDPKHAQDAAERRHRARVRQAGSRRRGGGVAEGARGRARLARRRAPRVRRSTACARRIQSVGGAAPASDMLRVAPLACILV